MEIDGKEYDFTKLKLRKQLSMQAQVLQVGLALAQGKPFDHEFQASAGVKLFKHMTVDGYEVKIENGDDLDDYFDEGGAALYNQVFIAACKVNFPSIFAKLTALAGDKDSALSQGLKKSGLASALSM